ncbi:MAG: hypothetical protein AAFZ49_16030, partial [Cyanobacteria bacterium J06659_2]
MEFGTLLLTNPMTGTGAFCLRAPNSGAGAFPRVSNALQMDALLYLVQLNECTLQANGAVGLDVDIA